MAMLSVADLTAQEVVKSDVTESREGKNYYIHTTEAGQTLFAISKAYDVAVDELIFENPDAADGLSIDELLRIPVISREKQISSELRSDDFRFIFHIVKKGETLYSIARIYDVPVADLKEINPEWESGLSTGQYIKIPMKESQLPIVAKNDNGIIESNIHTVGTGETLYSISRKYRVSIPALKAVNPGISNTLSIGQKVHIPVEEQATSAPQDEKKFYEHKVAAKETLYGIARTYRVSIDSLMSFNEGLTKDILAGEVIRIPIIENETEFITHQVREKTKLKRLASKYALSVSVMKAANPDFRSRLYPGDVIRIPVGTAGDVPQNNVIVIVDRPDEEPPDIVHKHDSIMCYDIEAPYKGEIKVALMIPFYSEETREINISGKASAINPAAIKSFNFIHFYEGFLMAMKDLEAEGLRVRLYVYDIDDKVSKTIQVLQRPELAEMDLIIGPFFSRNFKLVSNFAEMYKIKIVNPLTRRTEVLNNPYVYKMKPARDAQPRMLVDFVKQHYPKANIILVRNNKFQYTDEITEIKSSLDKVTPYGVKIANADMYEIIEDYSAEVEDMPRGWLQSGLMVENRQIETEQLKELLTDSTFFSNGIAEVIYAQDSIHGIIRNASIARENLIVVFDNNEIHTPEILTRLNDLKDTFNITVVGMPEWELLDNLETDYLLDLKVYFFTDSYYDYEDEDVLSFIYNFREKYITHPNQYAFDGYDIATYFLGAMLRFGPDCSLCLPYYNKDLLKTKVEFEAAYPAGYENMFWNLCRYFNYRIVNVPGLK